MKKLSPFMQERQKLYKVAGRILVDIQRLEKKFGSTEVRFALSRYLSQSREVTKRRKEIAKLESELAQLKRKELR